MNPGRRLDDPLAAELARWPPGTHGVMVVDQSGEIGRAGDVATTRAWASVTKLLTALTVLHAVDEQVVGLDDPAGPPGSTVRHLLAHASGIAADSDRVLASPGVRRIYSNRGIERVAEYVAMRRGRDFGDLIQEAVLGPLQMKRTQLHGSPARGAVGPVTELSLLARELLAPKVIPDQTLVAATTVTFPGLAGILPGFGRQEDNQWGLGFEIRARKSPHWTSDLNSETTFGHFGQSGSFLWVDRLAGVACVSAADTPFGPWACQLWPALATRVLRYVRGSR
jgi:CubicO group peptidase (beta-lactamase class C family)